MKRRPYTDTESAASRATVDDLKLLRDGWLAWGVKPRPVPRPRWLIEFDEDGLPARMYWNPSRDASPEPAQFQQ